MKSTWFSDRAHYDFARSLQAADSGRQSWDLLRLWLECATCSLQQAVHRFRTGELDAAVEARYMRAIGEVKQPKAFSECMVILTEGLEARPHDFIGDVIQEMGQANRQWAGQCFTPMSLCQAMCQMTLGDVKPIEGRRLMLSEPACGGGAMVIAAAQVLRDQGFCPWHYWFVANDVDWRMYAATYIQTTLMGIPATVMHANTISLEVWETSVTLVGAMHPIRRGQRNHAGELVQPGTGSPAASLSSEICKPLRQRELFAEIH